MANDRNPETNHSGELGERNRNTPGRTPRELGLDPDSAEIRANDIVGETPARAGDTGLDRATPGDRSNPGLEPDVAGMGEGGVSAAGGKSGGARGNSGTSNAGAGGPEGEARGGPGEYKGTSRMDLDHGTLDRDTP